MTTPKEVGMLFSGPMVRAVLEGRKSQTRRTQGLDDVNDKPESWAITWQGIEATTGKWLVQFNRPLAVGVCRAKISPGDTIYVKETHGYVLDRDDNECIVYRCDGEKESAMQNQGERVKWKPSIFMPKASARIWLTCTAVRCERLGDITEAGAMAEGVIGCKRANSYPRGTDGQPNRAEYAILWDTIHGKGAWDHDQNKFVWVYSFERKK